MNPSQLQTAIDNLELALASGVTRVTSELGTTEYRSRSDMLAELERLRGLQGTLPTRSRRTVATYRSGF